MVRDNELWSLMKSALLKSWQLSIHGIFHVKNNIIDSLATLRFFTFGL